MATLMNPRDSRITRGIKKDELPIDFPTSEKHFNSLRFYSIPPHSHCPVPFLDLTIYDDHDDYAEAFDGFRL